MKRLFAFFIIFTMLTFTLCACAQTAETVSSPAAADSVPTLNEGSHSAEATPYVRTAYSVQNAERAQSEAEGWDESYRHVGKIYASKSEMEYLQSLPQDEETTFAVNDMFGYKNDPRMSRYDEMINLDLKNHELFEKVLSGEKPDGEYDFDRSAYTWAQGSYAKDYLDKLPLEWFVNQQELQQLSNQYSERDIAEIMNEYVLKTADAFASLGCHCKVQSFTSISDEEDITYYKCFVYATPEDLWELGESPDNIYLVERAWPEVLSRYNTLVCEYEGA